MKNRKSGKLKKKHYPKHPLKWKIADKTLILSVLVFVFALFLLDVNANLIGAYGQDTQVNLFNGRTVPATYMFWTGFIFLLLSFLVMALRSMYHPKGYPSKLDILFSIIGVLGLMIILSGGLLIFWFNNSLEIPFFSYTLTRITYYHVGIVLEVIVVLYFAITK
jgi:magnesium-transporting ATPase (P-type)